MDRLPIETVQNIIRFIDASPSDLDRQHALSVLSRTNKTFNKYLSRKLYLNPVLTSEKRVELWSRTYWARSNPWNLLDPQMSFKKVIVPISLTLLHEEPSAKKEDRFVYRQRDAPANTARLVHSPFASHYLRSLTSLTVWIEAPSHLLAYLLGMKGLIRTSIKKLDLQGLWQRKVVLFVFEAVRHLELDYDCDEATISHVRDTLGDGGLEEEGDDYTQEFHSKLMALAHRDYSVFEGFQFHDEVPLSHDYFWSFNENQWTGEHPFQSLTSLTLEFDTNAEVLIIFRTDCLPCLGYLTLLGDWKSTDHLEEDIQMWRYVTAVGGYIVPPQVEDAVKLQHARLFVGDWCSSMGEDETGDQMFEHRIGIDLIWLDLEDCTITLGQE
ncbi:hypothetical protein JCM5353_006223 [Sporobolomyces roseus]